MSQFEKAVKQSDEQFLRAVGIDKAAFNLILERVATYTISLKCLCIERVKRNMYFYHRAESAGHLGPLT